MVFAVMALIVVPGVVVSNWGVRPDDDDTVHLAVYDKTLAMYQRSPINDADAFWNLPPEPIVEVYEQGWPRPYLVRSRGYARERDDSFFGRIVSDHPPSEPWLLVYVDSPGCPGPGYESIFWSNADNWPYRGDVWRWHWGNTAIDASLLLAAVCLAFWGTQRWLRWRGGLFRLRVIELLAGTTVCALGIGWHQYHVRLQGVEDRIDESLEIENADSADDLIWRYVRLGYCYREYVGPEWLRRLIGHEELLPFLEHVTTCRMDAPLSADSQQDWRTTLGRMNELPYLESVIMGDGWFDAVDEWGG